MTKSLSYTASSLGNHEFDDGVQDLVKFAAEVNNSFPLLACNLVSILLYKGSFRLVANLLRPATVAVKIENFKLFTAT